MNSRLQATANVQIDNERVIVTRWDFESGAETGWHQHAHDYVVVPLQSGQLLLEEPDGNSRVAELTEGVSYFREFGVEHNVVNSNDFKFSFIEIEIK